MTEHWIEIEGPNGARKHYLDRALTRVGGAGADVVLEGTSRGELQLWNDPAKAVWLGGGGGPRTAGQELDERFLADGDRIEWGKWTMTYRESTAEAVLEEVGAARAKGSAMPEGWRRIKAGILVEQGLADRQVVKRWSDAVVRGEFQPEACARELLAASDLPDDDPRVLERSSRLLRDFVMTPAGRGARGAGRKMKGAAKNTAAAAVAQFIIVGIILLMTFVGMVLARLKWDTSFDGWIDAILGN
ncbi:MAG: hypothetical protein H6831_06900 [Planctomycetes bacterium]|nr:hypothetical protein [Planctomycetota bacterium]MCB9904119.1 hypothetical protein [Planctomycetota bacterium]